MSTPRLTQRRQALEIGNTRKSAKVETMRALRANELSVVDIFTDPPESLQRVLIPTLLLKVPYFGREKLRQVGRRAARDNVNLLTTLGAASQRTREWLATDLAEHVWERRESAVARSHTGAQS